MLRTAWQTFVRWLRSDPKAVILDILAEHGERFGLEIVALSEGLIGRGTVYVHLYMLEEDGLVSSREVPNHTGNPLLDKALLPRRLYRITQDGHRRRAGLLHGTPALRTEAA